MTNESSAEILEAMTPDYSLGQFVGGGGAEQYMAVGRMMLAWFCQHCNLQPHEHVLEVGCGIGRIAAPLTQYLTQGTYNGFDIVREGIEWCQKKITTRYPSFQFVLVDVHNQYYNPAGQIAASEFKFPYSANAFDFVFLTSVFTHMLPKDIEHYTAEIARVLKPSGRCMFTAYVISEQALQHLNSHTSQISFQASPNGYWTNMPDNPEAAMAYPQEYLLGLLRQNELEPIQVVPGEWWKFAYTQDIIIVRKCLGVDAKVEL